MYHKKPSGETVYTSSSVYFAEYNNRRVPVARKIVATTRLLMSEGVDVGFQRVIYVVARENMRYTKKGYYSRFLKDFRGHSV